MMVHMGEHTKMVSLNLLSYGGIARADVSVWGIRSFALAEKLSQLVVVSPLVTANCRRSGTVSRNVSARLNAESH